MKRTSVILALTVLAVSSWAAAQTIGPIRRTSDGSGGGTSIGMGGGDEDPARQRELIQQSCRRKIERVHALIGEGKHGEARIEWDSAWLLAITKELRDELLVVRDELAKIAAEQLAEAIRQYRAGNYAQALGEYELLNRRYATWRVGALARAALDEAGSDPACQAALQEFKAAQLSQRITTLIEQHRRIEALKAERAEVAEGQTSPVADREKETPSGEGGEPGALQTLPPQPTVRIDLVPPTDETPTAEMTVVPRGDRPSRIKALPPDKQARAIKLLLQIVETYAQTDTGRVAARDLARLSEDKELMKLLSEHQSEKKIQLALNRAEMYLASGMTDKAAQYFKDVVETWPDSEQAKQARRRLIELGLDKELRK